MRILGNYALLLALAINLSGCGFLASSSHYEQRHIKCATVVESALSQLGNKYKAGGASPKSGFDCSGLVWWSYNQHGIKIPRITLDQAKAGKKIHPKKAQSGDIVVFRIAQSPRGLHTGIYAGADKFIHSPGKGKKIKIDSLSKPYWKDKLVAVRRVP